MRKIILTVSILIYSIVLTSCAFGADSSTSVSGANEIIMQIGSNVMTVDGESTAVDSDNNETVPVIIENRTLLPVRAVVEAMGGSVEWNAETKETTLQVGNDIIVLTVGVQTAVLNNESTELDTAPTVINGRTMLPIRFIAESFEYSVEWSQETQTITITSETGNSADETEAVSEESSEEDVSEESEIIAATDIVNTDRTFNLENGTVTLNNGMEMPILGIGTYSLTPEEAEESVYNALMDGYRLIDTANAYMNERAVGRAIKKSGVPREEIFVTTKLWVTEYEDAEQAIDDTLERLDLDYIDLMLLHQPYGNYTEGYKGLEQAVKDGKIRAIGLSNFYEEKFDEIMEIAEITPAVLQNELNPYYQQKGMTEYTEKYGTVMEAWFPLGGRGHTETLFNDEVISDIAEAHGKTSAQVIIRWHLQHGDIAIPGSSNADHISENFDIFDFELSDEEMERIADMDTNEGVFDYYDEERTADAERRYTTNTYDFNAQE